MRTKLVAAALALTIAVPVAVAAPWDKAVGVDWTKAPPVGPASKWKAPRAKRLKLANGMALLVVENHALPLVAMELHIPGAGSAADEAGKEGLAQFTADLLDEGAGGLGALELASQIDRLGASVTTYAGLDAAGVSVSGLTKTLDATVALMTKVVTAPAFDEKETVRVHGDRLTALKLRRDRPREVAAMVLSNVLYGRDTAYGHAGAGYPDVFEKLTVADARAFYEAHYNPKTMTLIVAGDVDADALQTQLDGALGAWKNAKAKAAKAAKAAPAKIGGHLVLVDRPAAEQSDVRIGVVGIKQTDRRYYAVEVLATVLGGSFTSRLNRRLREELAYTYGIRAGQSYPKETGPFLISSGIFTPNTVDGLEEILRIVGELATADVGADELTKAKQNLILELPQRFQTNAGTAEAYLDLVAHGLPDTWYDGYAAKVAKITAKDVRAVAKTLIPTKSLVFVVVGDMAALRTGLEGLGLAGVLEFDPDGNPVTK